MQELLNQFAALSGEYDRLWDMLEVYIGGRDEMESRFQWKFIRRIFPNCGSNSYLLDFDEEGVVFNVAIDYGDDYARYEIVLPAHLVHTEPETWVLPSDMEDEGRYTISTKDVP